MIERKNFSYMASCYTAHRQLAIVAYPKGTKDPGDAEPEATVTINLFEDYGLMPDAGRIFIPVYKMQELMVSRIIEDLGDPEPEVFTFKFGPYGSTAYDMHLDPEVYTALMQELAKRIEPEDVIAVALSLVRDYAEKVNPGEHPDVYVVWMCKTLQNWKALLSTDIPDGRYYEATYNGDKNEIYLDAYQKEKNECVSITDWLIAEEKKQTEPLDLPF